ncbi:toxin-antitoxin system YwqK family antitoxin [Mucilaginibacter flavidus]|uniref:toxin-antitoxin system YwqK family antitoxin n=1 Tax=Mucilaginibacter flavidus TaxID=2949309 RepID=UPI002092C437|nr:hypothetical protein [Mucilaginibacter flavidus]MCO5950977.1 hypothetical protein [Mucilaginibacter flavidus]
MNNFLKKRYIALTMVGMIASCKNSEHTDNAKLITQKMSNGAIVVIGAVVNGQKEGLWIELNDSEKLSSQKIFLHNKSIGESISYFEDGKTILSRGDLINDKPNGYWIFYYYNHKIAEKGNYANGQRVGVWEYYLENGLLNKKIDYNEKKGKVILDNHLLPPAPDKTGTSTQTDTTNGAIVK